MNFNNPRRGSLPLSLPVAYAEPRRNAIAGLKLADAAMLAFNYQLQDVHAQAPSVDADQIMSLVRWLQALPAETAEATIELRMARAESLRLMLDDPDWPLPASVAERGRRLLGYLCRPDDLIPDSLPLIGHLDQALMVELSWSEFAGEVQDYLDYRRFCSSGSFRGSPDELRTAWETSCLVEASEIIHRQEIRNRGYSRTMPASRPFRVY